MFSFLSLGFLIGLRHALEADHVAAVVSLSTRGGSIARQAAQGALWGLGHTLTLLVVGGACVALGVLIPPAAERVFEALVGAMLVALGVSVFARLREQRVHFHVHRHDGGGAPLHAHFHAHRHAGEVAHADDEHGHSHARPSLRALLVGSVHGLAGSAALVVITAQVAHSRATALLYIALFGVGSIAGMIALAAAIAVPLGASARRRSRLYAVLCGGAGAFSVVLGARMLLAYAAAV